MSKKSQLALSLRPKRFSEYVGQERMIRKIKNLVKHRMPKAFLFHGPKGTGKTTTARILALSLQCRHQKTFGEPCDKCRKHNSDFPIIEINCASVVQNNESKSAAQAIRDMLSSTDFELLHGKYRVFIFDEAHDLSKNAQDVLLKYFEDSPPENVFIINSTQPEKIAATLRSRCMVIHVRPLRPDDIKILVRKGLKEAKSDLSSTKLFDALIDNNVVEPRLILNAVENYVAGDSAEDAVLVEGVTLVDIKSAISSLRTGDWPSIAKLLRSATSDDARRVRNRIIAYMKAVLLDSPDPSDARTKAIYEGIKALVKISWTDDSNQIAVLAAELATLCRVFKNYSF